jgi:hypothetical protein
MHRSYLRPMAAICACIGCSSPNVPGDNPSAHFQSPARKVAGRPASEAASGVNVNGGKDQDLVQVAARGDEAVPSLETTVRRIIRTAEIKLIVNDFERAENELKKLLNGTKNCYVAEADMKGASGSPRLGEWKVRLPVAQFDAFCNAVARLGIPETNRIDSKDVTEEYYDLEAHIRNKKIEEARLQKLLEKATGKLEEVLSVEREITRVRGEIEQQEGRLRLLANLTALTTVSIIIQEIKNYVPPQTPSFASSIATTFFSSFGLLIDFGKGLFLLLVALSPWFSVVALVAIPGWLLRRRLKPFRRARTVPIPPVERA